MQSSSTQAAPDGNSVDAVADLPPFPASWVDRLFDWARSVSRPTWLVYLGIWFLLLLVFSILGWIEGAESLGSFSMVAGDGAFFIVFYLVLMHYLDGVAGRSLDEFRPLLTLSELQIVRLRYELTTLPARNTWIAGAAGLLVTLLALPFQPETGLYAEPARHISSQIVFAASNFVMAIFIYHTLRQLRMVNHIHATAAQVNLYRRESLYAFSRLSARTGMGWILALMMGLVPRLGPTLTLEGILWADYLLLPLALLLFILPLTSMHGRLVQEKRRLQNEVNHRLESLFARLHGQVDANDPTNIGALKTMVDSLLVERDTLSRIPTWPWRAGTMAGFTSALLTPVVIWFLQQTLMTYLRGG
jgi:hypothetical protein